MKKSNLTKSLATVLSMALVLGSVPVNAAEIANTETEAIETTETVPESEVESETEIESETETAETVPETEVESESETEAETTLESETEAEEDTTSKPIVFGRIDHSSRSDKQTTKKAKSSGYAIEELDLESIQPEDGMDGIEISNFPSGGVAINYVNFPDYTFRTLILDQLDVNYNGKLDYFEAEAIESIELGKTTMTTVKGIEYFFNVEVIDLSECGLTSLDISQNKNLRELYCVSNALSQLDVSKNTKLEVLACADNNISSLDLTHNPSLYYLWFEENNLSQIDISKNPKLEWLWAEYNNLSSINLHGKPNLHHFGCDGNKISQLDVTQNPKLIELTCSGNKLKQLDVRQNTALELLWFEYNNIPAINLSNNYSLSEVKGSNQTVSAVACRTPYGTYVVDFASLMPSKLFNGVQISGYNYNASTGKLTLNNTNSSTVHYTYKYNGSYYGSMNVTMNVSYSDLPFYDVAKNAWYYSAVKYAYENGLLTGTSDTTFSPNGSMTRGMLVSVLYRLEGRPNVSGNSFPDVSSSKYYAKAVQWAAKNGIVSGYTNGNFGPEDPITREQMMKIFYNYVELKGKNMSGSANLSGYSDANTISPYAVKYVKWAVANGILTGSNGKLNPKGNATRAEVSAIMKRVIETYNLK